MARRRPLLALLVTLPLLLAGCSLKGDDAEAEPTPITTLDDDAPPGDDGDAPPPPSTTSTPPTSPTPPPPAGARNPVPERTMTHHHAAPPATDSFDVPADPLPTNVTVSFAPVGFTGMGTMCDGDARVRIVDPAGATWKEVVAKADQGCALPVVASNVTLAPGRWSVRFEGTANVTSFVAVGGGGAPPGGNASEPFRASLTHDYATPGETLNLTVPASAANAVTLRAHVRAAQTPAGVPACVGVMRIIVTAPNGDAWLDGVASQAQGQDECALVTTVTPPDDALLAAGEWSVEFQGQGAGVGVVEVGPPE